ncbi:hypothetical protein F0562_024105 [Nyssa sinensis]|uniref:Subtilisin-like protease SBT3.18 n=1 Tax=Nyssa sinensis TaxID=561372 RepID=A0A5J5BIH9_9ASTE|nr:hypothetical protein F0562_024105 [Nyssa sinensis]
MAASFLCFWGLSLLLSLYFIPSTFASHVYIVYMGLNRIHDPLLTTKHHIGLLSYVFASEEEAKKSMLYSYKHSFSGFAAKLNTTQAATLANIQEVISVFKSKTLKLHTTRSWDFMGLTLDTDDHEVTPLQLAHGDDIIVGIFDTGIWPESPSFREEPCMGRVPKSWKGICVAGEEFDPATACNRKLIGARYYLTGFQEQLGHLNETENKEFKSPRGFRGHGTHTASTAVGSIVKNISFFGLAQGTARGGAPRARLAVYKVCWNNIYIDVFCSEADILKAFDDALHDGVHVISASFGASPPLRPFFNKSADIGSFHAMQKGVSVVFSAGNSGPDPSLVTNVAPWSICVAASSIDRTFPTHMLVDHKISVVGESLNDKEINAILVNSTVFFWRGICHPDLWRGTSALGMVILCFSIMGQVTRIDAEKAAWKANASGLIFAEPSTRQIPDVSIIPSVRIDINQGTKLRNYLSRLTRPGAIVQISAGTTAIKKSPGPTVAYFSSRGPSSLSPDILKPDLSAPGVNILAAWPNISTPTESTDDNRSVDWNLLSGTSMACPHVSGVVALIKSVHPDWSPAAIKSALMTTAYTRDSTHDSILAGGSMKLADPFDIGAGHINPLKAMDPGLVYDMKTRDYIIFLCNIGYTQDLIRKIVILYPGTDTSCPPLGHTTHTNLNYPSITVSDLQSTITIKRTVRNVGYKKTAFYFVSVVNPDGVDVVIWPRLLIFTFFRQEISYYITLKPHKKSQGRYDFGKIVWSDGFHYVRSPLIVRVNNAANYEAHTTI